MPKCIRVIFNNREININGKDIRSWDFDFNQDVIRIDLKSGSFYEFYKRNIFWVEYIE